MDAIVGNYAFMWDHKSRAISHPRDYFIPGYNAKTGLPETPWLDQSLYDAWQASGKPSNEFLARMPEFMAQSLKKKPAVALIKSGTVGLDCRYLNFSPQCQGWNQLTEKGGSGSFVIFFSGLWKLTTAATIPYYSASLNQPYQLDELARRGSASMGVALFKGDKISIDNLMKQADLAMYRSKELGRNGWTFFDPLMESKVRDRAALEDDLRLALDQKQFILHFQPQVLDDGRITGSEALVRWQHPLRHMVAPGDFIPLAEETGLILPLGNWVLEAACSQLAVWAREPAMAHLTVAVNVSAHQFGQYDFVSQVLSIIEKTNANPNRLKLELTESLLVADLEDIIGKMSTLKSWGVCFSLDDFGTGYSSLKYLKRLPLYQLKIDQSFVRDVLVDNNDAAIAKTIVTLAQSLGLGVIAEGVETESQRDFLAKAGCKAYQGYLFSRPLPLLEFDEFVKRC